MVSPRDNSDSEYTVALGILEQLADVDATEERDNLDDDLDVLLEIDFPYGVEPLNVGGC